MAKTSQDLSAGRQRTPLAAALVDTVASDEQIRRRVLSRVDIHLRNSQWTLAVAALQSGIEDLQEHTDPDRDMTQLCLTQIGLPVKLTNALEDSLGIVYVWQLLQYTDHEVARQPNLASKAVVQIKKRMRAINLEWPMSLADRVTVARPPVARPD